MLPRLLLKRHRQSFVTSVTRHFSPIRRLPRNAACLSLPRTEYERSKELHHNNTKGFFFFFAAKIHARLTILGRRCHGNMKGYGSVLQTGSDLPSGISFMCVRLGITEWEERGRHLSVQAAVQSSNEIHALCNDEVVLCFSLLQFKTDEGQLKIIRRVFRV